MSSVVKGVFDLQAYANDRLDILKKTLPEHFDDNLDESNANEDGDMLSSTHAQVANTEL